MNRKGEHMLSTALPKPTGLHTIATCSFHIIDTSRKDLYTNNGNGYREWMVRAWYPTESTSTKPSTFYANGMARNIKRRLTQFFRIPTEQLSHLDALDTMPTYSFNDTAVCASSSKYPVIFFSHGF